MTFAADEQASSDSERVTAFHKLIALGFAASVALTQVMVSILYGVSPVDASALALAAACLIVPTVLATVVPALRASRADPIAAMRVE